MNTEPCEYLKFELHDLVFIFFKCTVLRPAQLVTKFDEFKSSFMIFLLNN